MVAAVRAGGATGGAPLSSSTAAAPPITTAPSPPPLILAPGPAASERLHPGEVHLWWVRPSAVPDEAVDACARRVLSEEERQAAEAAGGAAALWRERVLTRSLVRCALARYLPWAQAEEGNEQAPPPLADPASLAFSRNDHGKPHLLLPNPPTRPPLEFNVTHTPELIGVAVCLAGPVHGGGGVGDGGGNGKGAPVAVALGLDAEVAARRSRAGRGARRRSSKEGQSGGGGVTAGSRSSSSSEDGGLTQAEEEEEAAAAGGSSSSDDDDGFRRLAARRFHPLEVQSLEAAAERAAVARASGGGGEAAAAAAAAAAEARSSLFVRLWTLKESVVKARGVGISHPPGLKGFSVELGPEDPELGRHLRELTGGFEACGTGQSGGNGSGGGNTTNSAAAPASISLRWKKQQEESDSKHGAFKLLLMQPCQGHVAALCVHALPSDGGGAPGSAHGSNGDGPRVAGAVRRVVSRHASIAGGDGNNGTQARVLAGTRWW